MAMYNTGSNANATVAMHKCDDVISQLGSMGPCPRCSQRCASVAWGFCWVGVGQCQITIYNNNDVMATCNYNNVISHGGALLCLSPFPCIFDPKGAPRELVGN